MDCIPFDVIERLAPNQYRYSCVDPSDNGWNVISVSHVFNRQDITQALKLSGHHNLKQYVIPFDDYFEAVNYLFNAEPPLIINGAVTDAVRHLNHSNTTGMVGYTSIQHS